MFFMKKSKKTDASHKKAMAYDPALQEPVLRCSICTSEQVAGFRDKKTGVFTDVMLIRSPADLESFRAQYGIQEEIRRIY